MVAVLNKLMKPEIQLLSEVLLGYINNDNTCIGLFVVKTVQASELFLAQRVPNRKGSKVLNTFLHSVDLHWRFIVWIEFTIHVAIYNTRFSDSGVPKEN